MGCSFFVGDAIEVAARSQQLRVRLWKSWALRGLRLDGHHDVDTSRP